MKKIVLFILATGIMASCASDNSETTKDQYDRTAMLTNWANNIIMPSLEDYSTKLLALKTAQTAFTAAPTAAALTEVRTKWIAAYKTYQHVAMFTIGKADEIQFTKYCNTFPASESLINNKIAAADTNLEGPANDVAQGFPALDYLLYGIADTPEGIAAYYAANNNASAYLDAVTSKLSALGSAVLADWKNGYKEAFIAKTDNTITGSVNKMVNAFVYFYEKELRTAKVGIPAGKFSNTPLPEKVEGYYSKMYSKELLDEALKASQNFFRGTYYANSTNGESLKSYLMFLGPKNSEGTFLADLMDTQFSTAGTAVNELSENLNQQVISDNTKMLVAFDALQRNVAYMKTDMVSAMSITIDYVDSDGD